MEILLKLKRSVRLWLPKWEGKSTEKRAWNSVLHEVERTPKVEDIKKTYMPQSITVVMPDGTIWTANGFTQVTPPETVVPVQTVVVHAGETVEVKGE